MDNYLIDRETLGKFVDELMAKKALPERDAADAEKYREEKIAELDRRISFAIVDALNDEQLVEFNNIMDRDDSPESYRVFFEKAGINVEDKIAEGMRSFGEDFLGGRNA